MPVTGLRGRQVLDGDITRSDINTSTAGSALIARIIAGTNISITSTGADSGTGDVTISAVGGGTTLNGTGFVRMNGTEVSYITGTAAQFVKANGTLDPSVYLTGNQSITLSGDATGSGTTAITITLANSGVTAGTYTKVTVDAKGRVTVGASLASGDLPSHTHDDRYYTETESDARFQLVSQKGQANGYASLDGAGKVPVSQLPSSIMEYKGTWNASTNSPTLADGTGDTGDVYRVSTAGTRNLGSGSITFDVGDYVIYNGTVWEKSDTTDAVASVNGLTGVVVLTTTNIAEGTNLYYTDARARAALSFTAGSGAYNSTTGVITIPTNTNQLTNGAGFITGYTETDTLQSVVSRGRTAAVGFTTYTGDGLFDAGASPITFSTPHGSTTRIGYHDAGGGQYAPAIGFLVGSSTHTGFNAIRIRISGEGNDRFSLQHSGQLNWGPGGSTGADTNLYRDSANVLKTDDTFHVGGQLRLTGADEDIRTNRGRFQVYNNAGTGNLGYRIRTDENGGWRWQFVDGSNTEYFGVAYSSGNTSILGSLTIGGNTAWHAGNDGSGSGLDSDTVDGVQLDNIVWGNARGTNDSVTTDNDALDKTGYYTSSAFSNRPSGVANWMYIEHIKLYNNNTQYQKQIGYDTYDDRMWVRTENAGTWTSWKQIWTSSSLTNLNQLTNGPGYITSYTETDTLATVVSRGSLTYNTINVAETTGGGFMFRTNSSWGGWARHGFSIGDGSGNVLASLGGYGGAGTSISYMYIGKSYLDYSASFDPDGNVELRHNNTTRLVADSLGVSITGRLAGGSWASFTSSTQGTPIVRANQEDTSAGYYLFQGTTGNSEVFRVERTGSGYFAGSVGIGASPSTRLHVEDTSTTSVVLTKGINGNLASSFALQHGGGGSRTQVDGTWYMSYGSAETDFGLTPNLGGGMVFWFNSGATTTNPMTLKRDGSALFSGAVRIGTGSAEFNEKLRLYGGSSFQHDFTQNGSLVRAGHFFHLNTTTPAGSSYYTGIGYTGAQGYHINTFNGSSTIPNSVAVGGVSGIMQIIFGSASSVVTLSQAYGLRSVSALHGQIAFGASQASSSISHVSGLHIYAPYYTGANNPTITNFYGIIVNDTSEYSGVTITNKWGIYQAGSSDNNYFNGKVMIGTTTVPTEKLYVNGTSYFNGNMTVNGTITELSTIRIKNNVETLEGSLEKLDKLRGVSYNRTDNNRKEIGLIAEEVEQVYPEFVAYDNDGNAVGLHYARLTAVLLQSIKELNQKINNLENRN